MNLPRGTGVFCGQIRPRSLADKERDCKMSSMWRAAVILPVLLVTAPSSSAQYVRPLTRHPQLCADLRPPASAMRSTTGAGFVRAVATALPITPRFLIANHDWPQEIHSARMGGKGHASGRERCHGHGLLRERQADQRQRLGAACRSLRRVGAAGRGARRGAPRLGLRRPRHGRRAEPLVTLRLEFHRHRSRSQSRTRCYSPKRPTRRRAFIR